MGRDDVRWRRGAATSRLKWARDVRGPHVKAAEGGTEVLQWARQRMQWDATTCAGAAWGGHPEVLQWARENGCEWDKRTCSVASRRGHVEVLKWARRHGCPWNKDVCLSHAEQYGRGDVVDFIRSEIADVALQ